MVSGDVSKHDAIFFNVYVNSEGKEFQGDLTHW